MADKTVQDVYDELTDQQKNLFKAIINPIALYRTEYASLTHEQRQVFDYMLKVALQGTI